MKWERIVAEAAVLMIAAAILGAGSNSLRPATRKLAWTLQVTAPPKDPGLLFLEITGEAALRLHRTGALFLDARRSSAYEQGHIPRALSIPVWEYDADKRISALVTKGFKPDAVIVTYCAGGECEDAIRLSLKLAQAGFYNVFLYKRGFPAWQSRGWPITRGKQP